MPSHIYFGFWGEWELNQKVVFDGPNRLILVSPEITEIDIKIDLYQAWKDWAKVRDNLKFTQAMSSTGGDPLPGERFLGSTFFLVNNWKIVLSHGITFVGNLFSDDGSSPFVVEEGVEIATSQTSTLVERVDIPAELVSQDIATAVWSQSVGTPTSGTFGAMLLDIMNAKIVTRTTTIAGSTTSIIRTLLNKPDDYYNNMYVQIIDGTQSIVRRIDLYVDDGSIYPTEALPFTPSIGSIVFILGNYITSGRSGAF